MARRRHTETRDADVDAVLEEAETIAKLATYNLRIAEPPLPGFHADLDLAEIRELCEGHRDHPAAESMLETFEATDRMREEALHG